jgi:protein-ribulosamine 3-kinase
MSQCIPKVVRNHLPDHLRPEDFTPTTTSNVFFHRPTSQSLLVKLATGKDAAQLVGEIRGLRAMARVCPDLVPRIICSGTEGEQAWSITEWFTLQPSTSTDTQAELGRKLAQMHSRASDDTKDEKYGFDIPTHCGVTEQDNTWEKDWMTFFRDRRLGDLVNRIADNEISAQWERMRELVVPALLKGFVPEPRPSIIHGDLWSGNVGVNKADGRPVIYDPSCYYGHNEVELGMTRMFGGELWQG